MVMGGVKSSTFPSEGMGVPAGGLIAAREASGTFGQMEFWDPGSQMWISGANASVVLDPANLRDKRIWFRNPVGAPRIDLHPGENDRVTIRPQSEPSDVHYEAIGRDLPDPSMDYLDVYSGRWVPGADIEVIESPSAFGPGVKWEHKPSGMEVQAGYVSVGSHELLARPRIVPTRLDYMMGDPDNPGAHLLPAVDLLSSPSYTNGGYEILGPDGRWHVIEEVYQDDPDEEEMELIADGLHLPHLDTSEEISVRRAML